MRERGAFRQLGYMLTYSQKSFPTRTMPSSKSSWSDSKSKTWTLQETMIRTRKTSRMLLGPVSECRYRSISGNRRDLPSTFITYAHTVEIRPCSYKHRDQTVSHESYPQPPYSFK
jgi:hypothetical protein